MIRRINHYGFTIVELMVFSSIMAFTGIILAHYFDKPTQVQTMMNHADALLTATNATNILMADLQAAASGTVICSVTDLTFQQLTYDFSNPTNPPQTTTLDYSFQLTPGTTQGAIYRSVGTATPTLLLNYVDAPTATNPLAQVDATAANVLMVTVLYDPTGTAPIPVIRRVALRG